MAVTTAADLKLALGITDSSQDTLMTALAAAASAAVETYCGRTFDAATYTEQYTGNRYINLPLRVTPVTSVTNVWVDINREFGSDTLLTQGTDYILDVQGGTPSKSGMLILLQYPNALASFWPFSWSNSPSWGGLTQWGRQRVGWPAFPMGIKVVYVAGYNTIPADLNAAGTQIGCWLYQNQQWGGLVASSQSYIDTSLGLQSAVDALGSGGAPALGSARQLLQRYKYIPIGYGP